MKKVSIIAVVIMCIIIGGIFFTDVREPNTDVTQNQTKVGMVLNTSVDDKSWGQAHYEGMEKTAAELNLSVTYLENVAENGECDKAIDELAEDGCRIIISASSGFEESTLRGAEKYPDIYFFQLDGTEHRDHLATYYGRIYQMRYLTGIIAGLQTESNKIGFLGAYPVDSVIRGLNAFALGVRSVNPEATIYATFANSWSEDSDSELATNYLFRRKPDIDVLAMHTNSLRPLEMANSFNIWSIGFNYDNSESFQKSYLTAALWNWEEFYTPRILECLQGKFAGKNYWDGVDTGIVSLAPFTKNVKPGIKEKVDEAYKKLQSGTFDVFYGPIKDQTGTVRIPEGENMSDDLMLEHFDWFVEGVVVYEQK